MSLDIRVTVNGTVYETKVEPSATLLHLLRNQLHLTGAKEGCGIGECGACSVILNGTLVNACLVLAVEADGSVIQTVEGECCNDQLSALQQAFIDHHALQCGFCTPGMIMSARDLLSRNPHPTDGQIVEAVAGNLCRCTGYESVLEAIRSVAGRDEKAGAS